MATEEDEEFGIVSHVDDGTTHCTAHPPVCVIVSLTSLQGHTSGKYHISV